MKKNNIFIVCIAIVLLFQGISMGKPNDSLLKDQLCERDAVFRDKIVGFIFVPPTLNVALNSLKKIKNIPEEIHKIAGNDSSDAKKTLKLLELFQIELFRLQNFVEYSSDAIQAELSPVLANLMRTLCSISCLEHNLNTLTGEEKATAQQFIDQDRNAWNNLIYSFEKKIGK